VGPVGNTDDVFAFLKPLPDAPPLQDRALIDRMFRGNRVRAIVGLTILYGFYYTCRIGLNVIKKPLIDAGVYNADELGTIGACLLGAYAFGKLANGVIADRVNVARFLPLGLALSAVANVAMGMTSLFVFACAIWIWNGYFQGVGAAASVKSLTHWYTGSERGRVYGIWSAAHSIGEFLTHAVTSRVVEETSWRAAFLVPGLGCLVVALAALFILRDRPQSQGLPDVQTWKKEPHTDDTGSTREAQLDVLKRPAIWICALASALMYITRYGVNSWGALYLQEARDFTLVEANDIIGSIALSGFWGSIAYGFISDVIFKGRRPPATLLFGIFKVASLFVIFFGPHHTGLLVAAALVYGFMLSGLLAVLGGLFAVDIASKKAAGMAMGFIGFVSYGGAVLQERLSGHFIHSGTTVGLSTDSAWVHHDATSTNWVLVNASRHIDFTIPVYLWVGAGIASLFLATTLWNVRTKE
jgi:OPA family sugar phosphate sensor protein UhpC-like MFS transporter